MQPNAKSASPEKSQQPQFAPTDVNNNISISDGSFVKLEGNVSTSTPIHRNFPVLPQLSKGFLSPLFSPYSTFNFFNNLRPSQNDREWFKKVMADSFECHGVKMVQSDFVNITIQPVSRPLDCKAVLTAYLNLCDRCKVPTIEAHAFILQCSIMGFKNTDLANVNYIVKSGETFLRKTMSATVIQELRRDGTFFQKNPSAPNVRRLCCAYAEVTQSYIETNKELTPVITRKYGIDRMFGFIGVEGLMSTHSREIFKSYARMFCSPTVDEVRASKFYRIARASEVLTVEDMIGVVSAATGDPEGTKRGMEIVMRAANRQNVEPRSVSIGGKRRALASSPGPSGGMESME